MTDWQRVSFEDIRKGDLVHSVRRGPHRTVTIEGVAARRSIAVRGWFADDGSAIVSATAGEIYVDMDQRTRGLQ